MGTRSEVTSFPLTDGGSVTLDANGNGSVILYPYNGWQEWFIERVVVRTTQTPVQTPFPQAEIFVDTAPNAGSSRGATASGHNDVFDASGGPIYVGPADAFLIVWSGGIPGTIARVKVTGTRQQRGQT